MKTRIVAPHKVTLAIRSRFGEPLCFGWGSKFGYLDKAGLKKVLRFPLLKFKNKIKIADDYVLVYQSKFGTIIKPPQIRLGRQTWEMTLRARIFHVDELQLVRK